MKRVWAYIKQKNLQDPIHKTWFTPDKTMAPVFGNEKINGFGMFSNKYLKKHLAYPGDPIASQSSSGGASQDLECPVCTEDVKPPMRLMQCGQVATIGDNSSH